MIEDLDQKDLLILQLLQADGRLTNVEIAKEIGLSPPSALQRVRRLEQAGYIVGYHAELSPEALGFGLRVYVEIRLDLHRGDEVEEFRRAMEQIPEVVRCSNVSGAFDFLLEVVCRDMAAYERLVRERLSRVPSVGRIQSCFVLSVSKSTQAPPLPKRSD